MTNVAKSTVPARVLAGGGEMGNAIRAFNWAATPLGAIETWSDSLRTAVNICLNSRFPMVIWWSCDLILLYNDAWRPILGSKHPQALGKPGREVWAEIWDIIGAQLNSVLATGEATWSDDLLLMVDRYGYAEEAYFTYSYSPIFLSADEIGGAFTAVTETTQRVLSERRLATLRDLAAQAGLAKTVEQALSGAIQTLAENPADVPFALLYQLDADETQAVLRGSTPDALPGPARPAIVNLSAASSWMLDRVCQADAAVVIDDLLDRFGALPAGSWSVPPQQAIALPIRAAGQESRVALLIVGVNPCRALNDDYRNFFEMVAGHIATAIANACAYEEERKRAEALAKLDQAKTVFFSNVSHEFRTPLTLMLSPLEELLTTDLNAEQQQQLELVHRNSLRLLKLVNTLLDFSRIEAGRIQAVYEPTDLTSLTAELASVFRSAIERVGLRFEVQCEPLSELAYVDREMWEKVVLNLLSNAFKFTFEGEIVLTLRAQDQQAVLTVRDTGTGIPAAELPHLFERFHRVQGARSRIHEGSGIGLALVQELVRLHGGQVTVDSEAGRGTTFTVVLPLGRAHLPADRIQAPRTIASTAIGAAPFVEEAMRSLPAGAIEPSATSADIAFAAASLPLGSHAAAETRLLLVDDNADMRDYLKRLLQSRYAVEAVADGEAALAAVRRQLPDLVLSDVMMPRLDGFGLLRSLRADEQTRAIPVILLSARAGEEARVEGLEGGADDYLIKPFTAKELLARVGATLEMARLRRAAAQREQQLRAEAEAARDQIRKILESITDAFVAFDREWRYTYVNHAAAQILDRSPEELLGKQVWNEVFPMLVGGIAYQELHRAVETQVPAAWEEYAIAVDRWLEVKAYPSDSGIAVYFRDISERKQAEESLRQSELNFRTLADTMPQMFWTTQPDGYHEYFNQRWYEYTGMTLEQTRGWGWSEVLHSDDYQRCMDTWTESLRTGKDYSIEYRLRRSSDSEYRWFLGRAFPLRGEGGQILRWFGSCTDIHDQRSLLEERDQALARERIAREQAETANRIKDEFLAVLSHELRSPLNPILGWTKLLQTRSFDPASAQRALETIERNARLQTQLIDDLLDVSRILRGKMALNVSQVDLATVIEDSIETVRLAAEAKSIALHTTIAAGVEVSGDAGRLQQVVWNLLSNAVKFTPAGGEISISLQCVAGEAQIQVRDTGKGISPAFLPYVFEYFRQEDGKTTRQFGGLGLGLAIVRHLVEQHGGTVQAESAGEGQGSTFTVRLPLLKEREQRQEEPKHNRQLPAATAPLEGLKILIVDDEADMRELLVVLLEQHGAAISAAPSAAKALALLTQLKPDLLISDIGMPEMDGYTLLRQVRTLSPQLGGNVPAIALTAYAGELNQQQAIAAGFQKHLSKPVDPDELVQAIVALISE